MTETFDTKNNDIISKKRTGRYCLKCKELGVQKHAAFGYKHLNKVTCCKDHRKINMVNLWNLMCLECQQNGEEKLPIYGYRKDRKKVSCVKHKKNGMVDLTHSMCLECEENGEEKRASYGYRKNKNKVSCSAHKKDGMANLVNNICYECEKSGEEKVANCGYPSNRKRVVCSTHKKDRMIELSGNMCVGCEENGNYKRAIYGYRKDRKKVSCSSHKKDDMVDLVHSMCLECEKNRKEKRATYGYPKKKKISCISHKKDGMVDLVHSMCIDCKQDGKDCRASYGYPSNKKKILCAKHKKDGMICLVKNLCDVCAESGIEKQCSYGPMFQSKTHCAVHKLDNEFRINFPKCTECQEYAHFGDIKSSEIPQHCENHKTSNEENMILTECDVCCMEYMLPDGQNTCARCLGWVVQEAKRRRIKEEKVINLLTGIQDKTGPPRINQAVKDGCDNLKPDLFYWEYTHHFHLIVECDEHQHSRYACHIQGELTRIINIYENGSMGFPLLFVRFNPDEYYKGDKRVKAYRGRENVLKNLVLSLKNKVEPLSTPISVIYLYYDHFDENSIKIEPFEYNIDKNRVYIKHKHPKKESDEHVYIINDKNDKNDKKNVNKILLKSPLNY